jgi:hypothetical protein
MLEAIILKALAKAPGERPASMAVLHSELELARGNTAASSEALARAQRLHPVPMAETKWSGPPEIRTLGDTAVSSKVVTLAASGRALARPWLLVAAGAAAVLGFGTWLAASHEVAPSPPPVPASARPSLPAPSPAPATVEILLQSTPPGASVFVGDVLVGITPTAYRTAGGSEPVEFVFRLPDLPPERVRALPAPGLVVSATLAAPAPGKPAMPARRKRAATTEAAPPTDIQTER